MREDVWCTLGYAMGAVIAVVLTGLVAVWVLTNVQLPPQLSCDVKPANLRGVKK